MSIGPIIARTAPAAVLLLVCGACGSDANRSGSDTVSAIATPPLPLTAAGGEQLYGRCATCHMLNGEGIPAAYPPLAGSEYVTARNPAATIRIVLRGAQGPVTVKGVRYDGVMPPYGTGEPMSDDQVAALLTYVRQAWGNGASAVTASEVARERALGITTPVTAAELERLRGGDG